jgi:nitrogen regulatory protein P-II 1
MSTYACIEIFTDVAQVKQIVDTIMRVAHTGTAGDGIVAVLPVDALYRIRDHRELHSLHGPNVLDNRIEIPDPG